MKEPRADSGKTKISLKEINRLAFPAILSGIAEPIIALIDTAMIGKVGTEALGAIGLGASLFLFIVWLLTQLKTAISAIVSKHFGSKTLEKIQTLIPQAIFFNMTMGLIVYGITVLNATSLLSLYSAEGEILRLSAEYFSIRAIGFPLVLATFTMFGIFRGLQNTSWAMQISIAGALLNLVLDYVLIFGIEDVIPAMGVAGAAWASLAAQVLMLFLAAAVLLKNTSFNLSLTFTINPEFSQMLKLGGGFFIRVLALYLSLFMANKYATEYGAEYIAAHTIAYNIWLFSAYFIDGYANAGNALAGRLMGEGNREELYRIGMKLMWMSIGIASSLALVYFIFAPHIATLFSDDPLVHTLFNAVFWMVILTQPINAVAFSFDGIFKGMGRSTFLMINLIIATLLGFVPTLLFCDYLGWKLHAIWLAFVVFMVIRGAILLVKFKSEFKPQSA